MTDIDLKKLAAPFPPDAVSWRAGPASNGKCKALAYIDARDVQDRLDAVCGPENWQVDFPWSDGKRLTCRIGIRVNGEWIWKGDGAGASDVEAEKGAFSDSFKRAAVRWAVGRYLYDIDGPWVEMKGKQIADNEFPRLRALLAKDARQAPAESPRPKPVETQTPQQPAMVDGVDVPLIVDGAKEQKSIPRLTGWIGENAGMLGEIAKKTPVAYDAVARGIFLHALSLCGTEREVVAWLGSIARNTLTDKMSEKAFDQINLAAGARIDALKKAA